MREEKVNAEAKKIFAIIGSASENSSNLKLVQRFADLTKNDFAVTIFQDLKRLPHFSPEHAVANTPKIIAAFRENIAKADGVLICTPEYVFSVPSGLKNAIEWCVATTVFSKKSVGLITASASGSKGHEELKMIMKTLGANVTEHTTLLIHGIKGKISEQGVTTDNKTKQDLEQFTEAFKTLLSNAAEE